ncbi:MAG TPA: ADP-ribosylglycohydrolase family protein [Anaerolineae bacterium]|nr:ADP-ribosylglycohydrolase family protein [Anaerolineae bacterium]
MVTLYEKVYGCLAASRIGSAMGAAVEGWTPEGLHKTRGYVDRVQQVYGYVDRLLPYTHYANRGIDWKRMPGTTEDGIERQKLMTQAIIDKQDRITAEDLYRTVVERADLDKMWYMTQPEDLQVIRLMQCGVPGIEAGRLSGWSDLNFNRATQPIGLINACDPDGAVRDVLDIGRLFYAPTDRALIWAGVYDAAIAEACKPDATLDSVAATALRYASEDWMKRELERAVEIAGQFDDPMAMREEFYKYYNGIGIPYAAAHSNETVCKGLAVFLNVKGDAKQAMIVGTNFGRDTDCLAATAGGLAGAFSGIGTVPEEWVQQVDEATMANPYTNIQCTIQEHADGLYSALQNRVQKMRVLADLLDE